MQTVAVSGGVGSRIFSLYPWSMFYNKKLLTEFSDDDAENDAECAHKLQGCDVSLQVELRMRECHVK
jgi:hypothetical protein